MNQWSVIKLSHSITDKKSICVCHQRLGRKTKGTALAEAAVVIIGVVVRRESFLPCH